MPRLPVLSSHQVVAAYRGKKRAVYQAAHESLCKDPFRVEDSYLSMFTKFEKQNLDKAPRGINPRSPRFNLRLGRYLKHAEHHYFKAINKAWGARTPATVIKGVNADRSAELLRHKWDRFDDPVAIGLDAEKFDMHVSVWALKYEHSFYTDLFPGSKELRNMLKMQLRNRGSARCDDGVVRFSMEGTRASGDLNTSLGNCILMCAMVWVYCEVRGVNAELANNGDDCVVFMERADLQRFTEGLDDWFKKRGFSMKVEEPVYEFEQLEFCQTHPVQLGTGWRMVRNYSACLLKDPICLMSIPNAKVLRKWMWAVGECGGVLAAGVPVLSAFYGAFQRNGIKCSTGMQEEVYRGRSQLQLAKGLTSGEITPTARVSFYYAFGLLPEEQIAMEQFYDTATIDDLTVHTVERSAVVISPGLNFLC